METYPSTDTTNMSHLTADAKVARKIVNKLTDHGLLLETSGEQLFHDLGEGSMRESDWRLLAEKALGQTNNRS